MNGEVRWHSAIKICPTLRTRVTYSKESASKRRLSILFELNFYSLSRVATYHSQSLTGGKLHK